MTSHFSLKTFYFFRYFYDFSLFSTFLKTRVEIFFGLTAIEKFMGWLLDNLKNTQKSITVTMFKQTEQTLRVYPLLSVLLAGNQDLPGPFINSKDMLWEERWACLWSEFRIWLSNLSFFHSSFSPEEKESICCLFISFCQKAKFCWPKVFSPHSYFSLFLSSSSSSSSCHHSSLDAAKNR